MRTALARGHGERREAESNVEKSHLQKVDRNQTYHLTAYQPRRRARIPRDEPAACAGAPRT
ncbi:unnamed protein product [Prorocentrum cordatum]|nr:unnamed protein product [Polarella glacialis]